GEDGPTHQPIEHLAALRAIPGLDVVRPADANEVAVAWRTILEHNDRPAGIILSRQNLPVFDRAEVASAEGVARGGYVLAEASTGTPQVILMGTGSVRWLAGTVIVGFALLHLGGLRVGTVFQNVTTLIKVLIIFGIAAAGILAGDGGAAGETAGAVAEAGAGGAPGLLAFALSYQAVAFAYYGWEDAAKMAEETRDPGRALPRILLGGAAAVAVLYLLMNLAFMSALSPAEMAGSELVAQDATAAVFGGAAGTVVLIASVLILVSSTNVNFMGLPRVAFGLARNGLAPRKFLEVNARGTPVPALLFISAIILVLALTGAFEFLIRFMMLVAITVDTMVLSALFRLRRTRPDLERPFRMPGYPWLPALTLVLYVLLLVIIVATQPGLAVGAGSMIAALAVAGVITARRGRGMDAPPAVS
ncbi:MAG: amino acid permease, partial [Gemmatimonadetes bacterium]|nr:amino acid permease [Gemmatimonadota bacterium]